MDLVSVSSLSSTKNRNKTSRRKLKTGKKYAGGKDTSAENFDVLGVTQLRLPHDTQVFLGCVVFEHVSFEQPWTNVKKENIMDHIDLYGTESPFFVLKRDIDNYPDENLLVGYLFDPSRDGDWFRIVHNVNTKYQIATAIKMEEDDMIDRIRKQVLRPTGDWESLGSEIEVDGEIIKNVRELFEIEIRSKFPKGDDCRFKMRKVEDARDGYVELLPDPRYPIETVEKSRVDLCTQTDATYDEKLVQTDFNLSTNNATQYDYEVDEMEIVDTKFERGRVANFVNFVEKKASVLEDCLVTNNNLNLFEDDYMKLVKNPRVVFKHKNFVLLASLTSNLAAKKLVTSVEWNYFESSMVAASYSNTPINLLTRYKGVEDEVHRAMYETVPVHLWSYDNEINPILYLDAKSDITFLSFCPYKKDILIGGAVNGQIYIWDLTRRVSDAEEVEVLSTSQKLNRVRLAKLTTWSFIDVDKTHVDPVYISPLKHSHSSMVVHIKWQNHTEGVSPNGKRYKGTNILQFLTFSIDGTVIVWDLNRMVEDYKSAFMLNYQKRKIRQYKLKHLRKISFLPLGKTLVPNYKLVIKYENLLLPVLTVLKGMNHVVYKPVHKYDENPLVKTKFKIAGFDENYKLPMIVGTAVGQLGDVDWFGYDFHEATNLLTENTQVKMYQRIHDGPIIACSVNPQVNDVILTVGGKVLAIWNVNEDIPLYWRKSRLKVIYNDGTWFSRTGSLFAVIRSDGFIDFWNLLVSTENCVHTVQQVGTKSINFFGGVTQADVRKNTFVVCDDYGTLSVYILPDYFVGLDGVELRRLQQVLNGQRDKQKKVAEWMKRLNENYEKINEIFHSNNHRARQKSTRSTHLYATDASFYLKRERKMSQVERMNRIFKKQDWKNVNEEEMFNIIMKQKKINLKELSKYRAPLEEAANATKEKSIKTDRVLFMKDAIFKRAKDNIVKNQPKTVEVNISFSVAENHFEFKQFLDEYDYIQERVLQFIDNHSYEPVLNWQTIMDKAKGKLTGTRTYDRKSYMNVGDFLQNGDDSKKVEFINDYKVRDLSFS